MQNNSTTYWKQNLFLMNRETTPSNSAQYLTLSQSKHYKLTNHRKILCSKYSGRYLVFFEDASPRLRSVTMRNNQASNENILIDEDVEPP
ncbi:MAG: hypothetical protein KKF62_03030 [Bacteroidetes bacterium]|nr:hypothetical protein [Bacteroidota bacterium]MBU1115024.1 hypothetical protein [Bacteroidota bacterium]MBU1799516.1 hypothetical protein [Bacteroidota bacterium]